MNAIFLGEPTRAREWMDGTGRDSFIKMQEALALLGNNIFTVTNGKNIESNCFPVTKNKTKTFQKSATLPKESFHLTS